MSPLHTGTPGSPFPTGASPATMNYLETTISALLAAMLGSFLSKGSNPAISAWKICAAYHHSDLPILDPMALTLFGGDGIIIDDYNRFLVRILLHFSLCNYFFALHKTIMNLSEQ